MNPDFTWVVLSQPLGHMCRTVPTMDLSKNTQTYSQAMTPDITQVLQSQPATASPYVGHLGPVRGWLPLASMPLINQRGQYKSDIIAADAVGSAFQCIFNTFYLSNLIIDGKNVKKISKTYLWLTEKRPPLASMAPIKIMHILTINANPKTDWTCITTRPRPIQGSYQGYSRL